MTDEREQQEHAKPEVQEPDPNAGRESALTDDTPGSGVIDVPPNVRTLINAHRRMIE